CRDDERFKLLQADLKEVLRLEGIRANSNSFIERYVRGDAAIHIHWRLSSGDCFQQRDFCAVVQSANGRQTEESIGEGIAMVNRCSRQQNVSVSMLVDIRQPADDPKDVMDTGPSVIRLHALDECISRFGNTRKILLKEFGGDWERIGERSLTVN